MKRFAIEITEKENSNFNFEDKVIIESETYYSITRFQVISATVNVMQPVW
jgi:hypothetical protein